ncbi:uncharacterized protein SETTUDRAFT_33982 [Exserohilum turcica Et28A]|uniref:Uncharacterized protein n=1 Tax=Exserohilum turcicum (strain 28A) TaxID=671987 RepID=R0JY30_EXST2|nr:uncharacterized protein SETTUDRAFT_33982 [Exserohilum turcica Et28A]EOA82404.1 hypothetical protein SETTUDRAFT_33982 [Exserohilum turcica Et28A]
MPSITSTLQAVCCILALSSKSTNALSIGEKTDELVKIEARQGITLYPCLNSGTVTASKAEMIDAASKLNLGSAPWNPTCTGTGEPAAQCSLCQARAYSLYGAALVGCTAGSVWCEWGFPIRDAVCIAAATFTLWSASQACYCAHCDCSDSVSRAKGNIHGAPQLSIGGAEFSITPLVGFANGDPIGRPTKNSNIFGTTLNCPSRGCR